MNSNYRNLIAQEGRKLVKFVSLASGPEAGDELSVTRQPVNWGAISDGEFGANQPIAFNVPGGSTVRYVQYWSRAVGGVYFGAGLVPQEVFGGNGVYTIDSVTIRHRASVA